MFTLIIASSASEGASIACVSVMHEIFFSYAEMRPEAFNALRCVPSTLFAERPRDLQIKAAES